MFPYLVPVLQACTNIRYQSFHSKGKCVKEEGLRGFAVWEVSGDFDDTLLNYIRLGAGYPIAAQQT